MNLVPNYLSKGWSVFPVPRASKVPKTSWAEYQKRRPTLEETRAWQGGNIGIVTGPISNLAVIDLDGPAAIQKAKELGIDSPVKVKTNRGFHLYFQYAEGIKNSASKIAEGIDVRGEGGYVLAPPSIHPDGAVYHWMGDFKQPLPTFPMGILRSNEPGMRLANQPGWIGEALDALSEGRTPRLAKLVGRFMHDGWLAADTFKLLEAHAKATGYDSEKLRRLIEDMYGRYPHEEITEETFDEAAYLKDLEARATIGKDGLCTGFRSLDELLGNFQPSELSVFAARSGYGKTTFALTVAEHLRAAGFNVLYFSTEIHKSRVVDKLVCISKHIPFKEVKTGRVSGANLEQLRRYLQEFKQHPITIDATSQPTIEHVRRLVTSGRYDIFIFDHINHVGNDRDTVAKFARGLKHLCKESKIPCIALAMLNEPPRDKNGKEMASLRSDVRECKETLMDADNFLFFTNPFMNKGPIQPVDVMVGKARYGAENDKIQLHVDKTCHRFLEINE